MSKISGYDDAIVITGVKSMAVWQGVGSADDTEFVKASGGFRRDPRLAWINDNLTEQQTAELVFQLERNEHLAAGRKWCFRCGEWQDRALFTNDPRNHDGKDGRCNTCRAEQQRRRYADAASQQMRVVRPYRKTGEYARVKAA